ncbi:hypothetical protein PTUN_b0276 [Pseudoalteromonas tunicata]|nr:hypothetical protein PTUN_b0276 [Pseudoalteromonas tunicata]
MNSLSLGFLNEVISITIRTLNTLLSIGFKFSKLSAVL